MREDPGLTLGDIARHYGRLTRTRDRRALIVHEGSRSWGDIDANASRVADMLISSGVHPGDRVAVLLGNRPEYVDVMYGVARAGAVIVPVNARFVAREVRYCLERSGAGTLITADPFAPTVHDALSGGPGLDDKHLFVLGDASRFGRSYEDALAGADPAHPGVAVDADAPYWMAFTSGTTGPPKAALVSHRRLLDTWNCFLVEFAMTRADTLLLAAPIYAGIGFNFALAALYAGGALVMLEQFDPAGALEAIAAHRVTFIPMPPTMYTMVMDSPAADRHDRSSVRVILSLGSPLLTETKHRLLEFFPEGGVFEFYGSTEIGATALIHPEDQHRKERSVGQAVMGVDIRLLDNDGRDVAVGEVGEIYKRGVTLGAEYYENPEATESMHRGEWITSHDLGRFDEEGYLYVVDRKKDMIVTGGLNVYPSEVEEVIASVPGVALCAVIGLPHDTWGEAVTAFVVPKAESGLTPEAVLHACRAGLADYKRPKRVELVERLPLAPTGKVLKRALREQHGPQRPTESEA